METYYPSGSLNESFYLNKDEKRQGPYTAYYENGVIKEESIYDSGILNGIRKLYFESGALEIEETYDKKGNQNGPYTVYFPSGVVQLEKTYHQNMIKGEIKVYYPSGKIKEEVSMDNNQENGPFTEFYENGTIHWKGEYLNGDNEFGLLEEFDSTGVLIKKMMCDSIAICRTIWKPGMDSVVN